MACLKAEKNGKENLGMAAYRFSETPIDIPLDELDFSPGPYAMSFSGDLSKLEYSIRRIGLIHPPFIVRNQAGGWDIVTGYRRLQVLRQMGEKVVTCNDLTEGRPAGLDLLLINFFENLPVRDFNDMEKGMILRRLHRHMNNAEVITRFMPLLNLPGREEVLKMYMDLEHLEPEHGQGVALGMISMKSIELINRMNIDEKSNLLDIILKLKFNKNQQRHFIEYVQDLSVIQERPINRVLSDSGLRDILGKKNDNIPQKSREVLDYLKAKRFPLLTEAEKRLRNNIKKINLPAGSRITYDPTFESKDLSLEIRFENGPELLTKLKSIEHSGAWTNLKGC
jgi:hypothetical protein